MAKALALMESSSESAAAIPFPGEKCGELIYKSFGLFPKSGKSHFKKIVKGGGNAT